MIFLVRWWQFSFTVFMAVKPSTAPKKPEIERRNKIHRYEFVTAHTRSLQLLGKDTALQNWEEISAIFSESCAEWKTEWKSMLMGRHAQCCAPKSLSWVYSTALPWLCIGKICASSHFLPHLDFFCPQNPTEDQLQNW